MSYTENFDLTIAGGFTASWQKRRLSQPQVYIALLYENTSISLAARRALIRLVGGTDCDRIFCVLVSFTNEIINQTKGGCWARGGGGGITLHFKTADGVCKNVEVIALTLIAVLMKTCHARVGASTFGSLQPVSWPSTRMPQWGVNQPVRAPPALRAKVSLSTAVESVKCGLLVMGPVHRLTQVAFFVVSKSCKLKLDNNGRFSCRVHAL